MTKWQRRWRQVVVVTCTVVSAACWTWFLFDNSSLALALLFGWNAYIYAIELAEKKYGK